MKMDFESFKLKTIAALEAHYGSDAHVTLHEVIKPNDIKLTGVIIQLGSNPHQAVPVIYINNDYRLLCEDKISFDEYITKIVETRKTDSNIHIDGMLNLINNWEYARHYVYPVLVSADRNREMLQDLVSRDYLDLRIIYVFRDDSASMPENTSIKITRQIFNNYRITIDELHSAAVTNMQHDQYAFYRLQDLMKSLIGDDDPVQPVELLDGKDLYCLTNRQKYFGAAGILNEQMLKNATAGHDAFIFPSSIHELLVMLKDDSVDASTLDQMVRDINNSVVAPGDVLSDHVYFYSAAEGKLLLSA